MLKHTPFRNRDRKISRVYTSSLKDYKSINSTYMQDVYETDVICQAYGGWFVCKLVYVQGNAQPILILEEATSMNLF
jgi:hypothetical protein